MDDKELIKAVKTLQDFKGSLKFRYMAVRSKAEAQYKFNEYVY